MRPHFFKTYSCTVYLVHAETELEAKGKLFEEGVDPNSGEFLGTDEEILAEEAVKKV